MEMPWRPSIAAGICLLLCCPMPAARPSQAAEPAAAAAGVEPKQDAAEPEPTTNDDSEPGEAVSPAPQPPPAVSPEPGPGTKKISSVRPRNARQAACRRAGCRRCPDDCRYGSFDVLFLQRNVGTDGSTIAENAAGGQPVSLLTNASAEPATAAGVRLFYGVQGHQRVGWEIGYTGVYGMFGEDRADAAGSIQVPGGLGQAVQGWATANAVRPTYASSLNMFEANIFQHQHAVKGGRHSAFPWDRVHDPYCHSFDWLFGLRWAGLNETADLNVQTDPGEPFSAYSVTTSSQLIGPQIGIKERRQWNNWAVEGWAKTMLAGTFLSSYADPITSPLAPGLEYRPSRKDNEVGVGFVADLNYSLARRLGEHWWLRVGYNLIWVTGVALAPNQFDFTDNAASGSRLVGGSSVFLHGANLGIEARW